MKSFLSILLGLVYAATAVAADSSVLTRLAGKELWELADSGDYTIETLADVVKVSPVPDDAELRHYHVERYTAKSDGLSFVVYASYLDEEDGGNTYGWIENAAGELAARVVDSFIEAVPGAAGGWDHTLGNAPRAVAPGLDLTDKAAVGAYLKTLAAEYEQAAAGDVYLDDAAADCQVAADRLTAVCTADYQQDRWNGVITATFAVAGDKATTLVQAGFDGNY